MKRSPFTQVLAGVLSLALLVTSFPTHAFAEPVVIQPKSPDFVDSLTPPAELGTVVDAHDAGPNAPVVIHVQDLHANYEVQTHIAKLMEFYDGRLAKTPYRVAVEGAEGPVKIAQMGKLQGKSFKADVSDYLMKAAELTGTEYFAIVNGKPDALWGVENEKYHKANLDLFRSTFEGKEALADALDKLGQEIQPAKEKYYTRAMRKLDKKAAAFDKGELGFSDYALYLAGEARDAGVDLGAYPEIAKWTGAAPAEKYPNADQFFAEQAKLLGDTQSHLAQTDLQRSLAAVSNDINILKRFEREQISTAEVRRQTPDLEKLLGRIEAALDASGLPYDKAKLADTVSASLDFFAMALLRDQFLAGNTLDLMGREKLSRAVLVTGGFHTAGITKILRDKGVSYIVIAPALTQEVKSRDLYNARLMGHHATLPQIFANRMLSGDLNEDPEVRLEETSYLIGMSRSLKVSIQTALNSMQQAVAPQPILAVAGDVPDNVYVASDESAGSGSAGRPASTNSGSQEPSPSDSRFNRNDGSGLVEYALAVLGVISIVSGIGLAIQVATTAAFIGGGGLVVLGLVGVAIPFLRRYNDPYRVLVRKMGYYAGPERKLTQDIEALVSDPNFGAARAVQIAKRVGWRNAYPVLVGLGQMRADLLPGDFDYNGLPYSEVVLDAIQTYRESVLRHGGKPFYNNVNTFSATLSVRSVHFTNRPTRSSPATGSDERAEAQRAINTSHGLERPFGWSTDRPEVRQALNSISPITGQHGWLYEFFYSVRLLPAYYREGVRQYKLARRQAIPDFEVSQNKGVPAAGQPDRSSGEKRIKVLRLMWATASGALLLGGVATWFWTSATVALSSGMVVLGMIIGAMVLFNWLPVPGGKENAYDLTNRLIQDYYLPQTNPDVLVAASRTGRSLRDIVDENWLASLDADNGAIRVNDALPEPGSDAVIRARRFVQSLYLDESGLQRTRIFVVGGNEISTIESEQAQAWTLIAVPLSMIPSGLEVRDPATHILADQIRKILADTIAPDADLSPENPGSPSQAGTDLKRADGFSMVRTLGVTFLMAYGGLTLGYSLFTGTLTLAAGLLSGAALLAGLLLIGIPLLSRQATKASVTQESENQAVINSSDLPEGAKAAIRALLNDPEVRLLDQVVRPDHRVPGQLLIFLTNHTGGATPFVFTVGLEAGKYVHLKFRGRGEYTERIASPEQSMAMLVTGIPAAPGQAAVPSLLMLAKGKDAWRSWVEIGVARVAAAEVLSKHGFKRTADVNIVAAAATDTSLGSSAHVLSLITPLSEAQAAKLLQEVRQRLLKGNDGFNLYEILPVVFGTMIIIGGIIPIVMGGSVLFGGVMIGVGFAVITGLLAYRKLMEWRAKDQDLAVFADKLKGVANAFRSIPFGIPSAEAAQAAKANGIDSEEITRERSLLFSA